MTIAKGLGEGTLTERVAKNLEEGLEVYHRDSVGLETLDLSPSKPNNQSTNQSSINLDVKHHHQTRSGENWVG